VAVINQKVVFPTATKTSEEEELRFMSYNDRNSNIAAAGTAELSPLNVL